MRRVTRAWTCLALLLAVFSAPAAGRQSIDTVATPAEMAPFERLVGGRWYLGDDSFQTFTWGVGHRSVTARNYFVTPAGATMVGEMMFLFHPGRGALIGTGVAVGMGIDVFEYTSIELHGDTLVLDLETYGPQASADTQRETWAFTAPDRFDWTLWARGDDGAWLRRFGGTYERRR